MKHLPEKREPATAVGHPPEMNSALKTCNDNPPETNSAPKTCNNNPPETNGEQNTLGGGRSEAEGGLTAAGCLENHFKKPFLPADDESHHINKI